MATGGEYVPHALVPASSDDRMILKSQRQGVDVSLHSAQ